MRLSLLLLFMLPIVYSHHGFYAHDDGDCNRDHCYACFGTWTDDGSCCGICDRNTDPDTTDDYEELCCGELELSGADSQPWMNGIYILQGLNNGKGLYRSTSATTEGFMGLSSDGVWHFNKDLSTITGDNDDTFGWITDLGNDTPDTTQGEYSTLIWDDTTYWTDHTFTFTCKDPVLVCKDLDEGIFDQWENGCSEYTIPDHCDNGNDPDFDPKELCCFCGGGTTEHVDCIMGPVINPSTCTSACEVLTRTIITPEIGYGVCDNTYQCQHLDGACISCAVKAPVNGSLGNCTTQLNGDTSCVFDCDDGFMVSGRTSCSSEGIRTSAVCVDVISNPGFQYLGPGECKSPSGDRNLGSYSFENADKDPAVCAERCANISECVGFQIFRPNRNVSFRCKLISTEGRPFPDDDYFWFSNDGSRSNFVGFPVLGRSWYETKCYTKIDKNTKEIYCNDPDPKAKDSIGESATSSTMLNGNVENCETRMIGGTSCQPSCWFRWNVSGPTVCSIYGELSKAYCIPKDNMFVSYEEIGAGACADVNNVNYTGYRWPIKPFELSCEEKCTSITECVGFTNHKGISCMLHPSDGTFFRDITGLTSTPHNLAAVKTVGSPVSGSNGKKVNTCFVKNVSKSATCFDNEMNGDETGVDCGGSCDPCVAACDLSSVILDDGELGNCPSTLDPDTYCVFACDPGFMVSGRTHCDADGILTVGECVDLTSNVGFQYLGVGECKDEIGETKLGGYVFRNETVDPAVCAERCEKITECVGFATQTGWGGQCYLYANVDKPFPVDNYSWVHNNNSKTKAIGFPKLGRFKKSMKCYKKVDKNTTDIFCNDPNPERKERGVISATSSTMQYGDVNDCISPMIGDTSCQPTCEEGYDVSGPSICSEYGELSKAYCIPKEGQVYYEELGPGRCADIDGVTFVGYNYDFKKLGESNCESKCTSIPECVGFTNHKDIFCILHASDKTLFREPDNVSSKPWNLSNIATVGYPVSGKNGKKHNTCSKKVFKPNTVVYIGLDCPIGYTIMNQEECQNYSQTEGKIWEHIIDYPVTRPYGCITNSDGSSVWYNSYGGTRDDEYPKVCKVYTGVCATAGNVDECRDTNFITTESLGPLASESGIFDCPSGYSEVNQEECEFFSQSSIPKERVWMNMVQNDRYMAYGCIITESYNPIDLVYFNTLAGATVSWPKVCKVNQVDTVPGRRSRLLALAEEMN